VTSTSKAPTGRRLSRPFWHVSVIQKKCWFSFRKMLPFLDVTWHTFGSGVSAPGAKEGGGPVYR
jgi:hypothetical protein